jgi:RNA polymerase sigma-70 factor (ECF subfamily)
MKFQETPAIRQAVLNSSPVEVNAFVGHFVTVLISQGRLQGLSSQEAEDATQESFAVFFRKLTDLRSDVKLSTFLFGIHLHSIREARRRRGRHESHGDLSAVEHLLSQNYDEKGHWKSGVAPQPIERLLEHEDARELEACIDTLPEKHRQAIVLSLTEDADGGELCHILGVSYANFRQLLTRARHALRLCLENYL